MRLRAATASLALAAAWLVATAPAALAHGGSEMELSALEKQAASTLAEQALAELKIRNDVEEAAVRLDAALESKDQGGVDMTVLRNAMETVDKGNPQAAVPLIDRALSRPPNASLDTALHEAGREFQPGTDAQEIVAIVVGAVLVVVGLAILVRRRRAAA